jgi:diguanylate cyclase (GGDEF)-like protein
MFSLRTRLLGLALLPAVAATGFAGLTVANRFASAAAASEVATGVDRVADLITIRSSLNSAVVPLEMQARIPADFGIEPDVALRFLGRGSGEAAASLANAADALDRLPPHLRPLEPAVLDRMQDAEDPEAVGEVLGELEVVRTDLQDAVAEQVSSLHEDIARLGDSDLARDLSALNLASRAYQANEARLRNLADFVLDSLRGAPENRARLVELAQENGRWLQFLEDAAAADGVDADSVLARFAAGPPANAFERGIAAVLDGQPVDGLADGDVLELAGLFTHGLEEHAAVNEVVFQSSEALRSQATAVSREALRGGLLATALIVAVLSAMLVALIRLARSIERPMSCLIERTRQVGAGDLVHPPLPVDGPVEIAAAMAAFNDVTDNLRLLEGKVRALANCSFEDPMLDARLPGMLGAELDQSVAVLSGSIRDRTDLQERLSHQATHDALTGLPNRAAVVAELTSRLSRGQRQGRVTAVAFLDLDGFKRANDTYGHAVGDRILRCVGERLVEGSRSEDFVARLGGDEFVVIIDDVDEPLEAVRAARRLLEGIGEPIDAGGPTVRIGASIGLAFAEDGGMDDAFDLLGRADLAVYRAKQSQTPIAMFDEQMQDEMRRRVEVEDRLRDELEAGGPNLEIHYQPIVRSGDGQVQSFEALLRWRDPHGGVIPPDAFIPVAESSHLIVDVDRWVLATALGQLAAWDAQPGMSSVGVAVNVSGRHVLSRDLADNVRAALTATGVAPHRLTIEVTETVLLDDLAVAADHLQELRDLGIRVAVDDFGTGYTSLAHLRRLPMDEIKIDRSFVSNLGEADQHDLVRVVQQLARQIGVPTIAEGVETSDQLAFLREIGCENLQGYFFGRPVPAGDAASWFAAHVAPTGW